MQTEPQSPFASVIGLGVQKSQHSVNNLNRWGNLVFAGLGLGAAPVLLLFTAYRAWDAYARYVHFDLVFQAAIWPLLGSALAFVVGAFAAWSAWRQWPLTAALYEHGFAFRDRRGVHQARWDQVEAVWQAITKHYRNGVYTGTTHVYTVQPQGGERIVLDDKLANVEALGTAIQQSVTRTLWPRYAQAAQSGQRLTFGPLAIDPQGLYSGNKSVRWDEIKAVKLERGIISIKKDGGWFNWASVGVPQIPNFFIFYELLGRYTTVE